MITILVTGGCGFIGSNSIGYVPAKRGESRIVNLDKLTYAGSPANLADIRQEYGPSRSMKLNVSGRSDGTIRTWPLLGLQGTRSSRKRMQPRHICVMLNYRSNTRPRSNLYRLDF